MDTLSMAMADFSDLWNNWIWQILLLVIGLGLVIFVHELGHFLTAKAVGIRVTRFSIGFGPKLWGFTRGETEYWISALPLGGYVKMPGQEDFKATEGESTDPRAFNNKPVWARLVVVSAGVVMNIIFAGVLFIVVCLMGIKQPAPVVSQIQPGFPAASAPIMWDEPIPAAMATAGQPGSLPATASSPSTAIAGSQPTGMTTQTVGLQPGDTVLAINGERIYDWFGIFVDSVVARPDETFNMTISREIDGKDYIGHAHIGVKADPNLKGKFLSFGIGLPPRSTVLAADVKLNGTTAIRAGDMLTAINGKEIRNFADIDTVLAEASRSKATLRVDHDGKLLDVPVRLDIRGGQLWKLVPSTTSGLVKLDAIVVSSTPTSLVIRDRKGKEEVLSRDEVTFAGEQGPALSILGLSPRLAVAEVIPGGAAEKAGLKAGDVIIRYADQNVATHGQLIEINKQYAGKGTNIVVQRDGKTLDPMWIVPRGDRNGALIGIAEMPDTDSTAVGLVQPNSPLAGEVEPGDKIETINGRSVSNWTDVYERLKECADQEAVIGLARDGTTVNVKIDKLDRWKFDPDEYALMLPRANRFLFQPLEVLIKKSDPGAALAWGARQTRNTTIKTYAQLRGLFAGTIPVSELRGPLGIGSAAVVAGRQGLSHLIYLMAIISISLAVINFLPIPVVDGGLAVMLIIEKVRGKPVPANVMAIVTYVGLALILGVFAMVMFFDIRRWGQGEW
ncbi:MAG: site-2 protease family protein [Phycisphaerae bacterium]